MKKVLLTVTALTLSTAIAACSPHNYGNPPPPPPPPPHGAMYDAPPQGQSGWDHGDMDEHMEKHMHMVSAKLLRMMDTNHDGVVTKKEYEAYMHKWFREADRNHDGKLTQPEIEAQMKRERMKFKEMHAKHQQHREEREENSENESMDNGSYNGGYQERNQEMDTPDRNQ